MNDEARGTPPRGHDWCPHGCQPLYELGECGMCGYQGDGVWQDATREVIDVCEASGRYTRQTREGHCLACGKMHGPVTLFGRLFHLSADGTFFVSKQGQDAYLIPAEKDGTPDLSFGEELEDYVWCIFRAQMDCVDEEEIAHLQLLIAEAPDLAA